MRRFGFRAFELVDGFAFGQGDLADLNRKSQLRNVHFYGDRTDTQLGDERMVARITPLRGIRHAKDKSLIPPCESLQSQGAARRKLQRAAGQIVRYVRPCGFRLNQILAVKEPHDMGRLACIRLCFLHVTHFAIGGEFEIEQTVGIVECRPQNLATGRVLECSRHTAVTLHYGRVHGTRAAKTRQRGTVGADQKDRFDQITA